MAPPGSRTKSTDVWLLPEDEVLFDRRIGELLPSAAWLCTQPGPFGLHQEHLHPTVEAAMDCGGTQAILMLPAGASIPPGVVAAPGMVPPSGPPSEAIVLLGRSRILTDDIGEHFRCGRLAVCWVEDEVTPGMLPVLSEHRRLVWKALTAVTRPALIEDYNGHRTTGLRAGPAARDLMTSSGIQLTRSGWWRYRLVTGSA